jgi:single-strand DNA-binding protein
MALNLNKVELAGFLTRDPEPIEFGGEVRGAKIGVAVHDRKLVDGVWTDVPTFVDVDVWDTAEGSKQGSLLLRMMRKGSHIHVEGKLKLHRWEDKLTGQNRTRLGVVCLRWQFVGKKDDAVPVPQRGDADDSDAEEPPTPPTPTPTKVAEEITETPRRGRGRGRSTPVAATNGNGNVDPDNPF